MRQGRGLRSHAVTLLVALPVLVACSATRDDAPAAKADRASADTSVSPLLARFSAQYGGAPGSMTPSQIVGTHLQVPCGGYKCFQPGVMTDGPVVGRSPASMGAQTVLLGTTIYHRDGTGFLTVQIQDLQQLTIPAGVAAGQFLTDQWLPNTGGSKAAAFYVIWGDEAGQALGWQVIRMDQSNDYTCVTQWPADCTVGEGFVTVTEPGP